MFGGMRLIIISHSNTVIFRVIFLTYVVKNMFDELSSLIQSSFAFYTAV